MPKRFYVNPKPYIVRRMQDPSSKDLMNSMALEVQSTRVISGFHEAKRVFPKMETPGTCPDFLAVQAS